MKGSWKGGRDRTNCSLGSSPPSWILFSGAAAARGPPQIGPRKGGTSCRASGRQPRRGWAC
eukprot:4348055-Pyramimonas_sp.AAC.1